MEYCLKVMASEYRWQSIIDNLLYVSAFSGNGTKLDLTIGLEYLVACEVILAIFK